MSNGPSALDIYATDGTKAGTSIVKSIDVATLTGGPGLAHYPTFTPDGSKIAVVGGNSNGTQQPVVKVWIRG